jgi:gliding motility-associated-like protein
LGDYSYFWTPPNANLIQTGVESNVFNVIQAGIYTIRVVNNLTKCEKTLSTQVNVSSIPVSVVAQLVSPLFNTGNAIIQAFVTGGYGTYEYSINNGITWQSSPVFEGLKGGDYQIIVRDQLNCGQITSNFVVVVDFPDFFTPNADGYNDTWNIRGLDIEHQANLYIFDKYGKLLKQFNPLSNEGWDGTFNNVPLPSTDYWFRIEYKENNQFKNFTSHFSLKR